MKTITLTLTALILSSCSTVPIAASYSGAAAGHTFKVGYSGKEGVGVVINQK